MTSLLLGAGLQDILIVSDNEYFAPRKPTYEYHWGHRFPVCDGRPVMNKNSRRIKRLQKQNEMKKEEDEKKKAADLKKLIGKNKDELEEESGKEVIGKNKAS